ncbi:Nn.00g068140.m01.CDS01 [Neocucurbitaria sp. VM-36]
MSPIPVIVCGKNPNIAKKVREGLLPEYDVIHIILSLEAGLSDIPLLLSGKTPKDTAGNLGSQNYDERPVAVAVGGGFNDEMFDQMKDAAKEVQSAVWVRADLSKVAAMPALSDVEAFGAATAVRVKKSLDELSVGKEGGKTEGVFYF